MNGLPYEWMAHNSLVVAALLVIGIAAGIFGALLGLGGGIIIVPLLTLIFGLPIQYAVGASVISIIATSSGAAAAYVRDHITNIRVAMLLEVGTTIGALGGALLSSYVEPKYLYLLFTFIMVYSALNMLKKRKDHLITPAESSPLAKRLKLASSYPDALLGRDVEYGVTRVKFAVTLMLAAGCLSALLGIGSGVLKVPAMDGAMRLPIKVSSATSNFMIGVTGAASAGHYYMRGDLVPFVAGPIAVGVIGGSWIGSRLMMRMSPVWIRRIFVVVLCVVAIQMGLKAFAATR